MRPAPPARASASPPAAACRCSRCSGCSQGSACSSLLRRAKAQVRSAGARARGPEQGRAARGASTARGGAPSAAPHARRPGVASGECAPLSRAGEAEAEAEAASPLEGRSRGSKLLGTPSRSSAATHSRVSSRVRPLKMNLSSEGPVVGRRANWRWRQLGSKPRPSTPRPRADLCDRRVLCDVAWCCCRCQ